MLKLQNFGHLMQRTDSLEKTLVLVKIEGRRRKEVTEDEMVGCNTDSVYMSLSKLWEIVKDKEACFVLLQCPRGHKEADTT